MRTNKTPIQNLMRTGRFLGRLVVEAFGNFNEEGDEWIFFFGVSLVAALAVGIVSHFLLMAVLAIHALILQLIYTGLLLVVNALILTLQLWVFWQTYRERTETGLYMVSLSLSAVGIALCIESFSALVLLLWPVPRTLGQSIGHRVWFVESYFLWHLADSLPFLKVPSSVGWRQPLLDEKYIGLLRLIFQIVVLAPLVHIATSGYETWQRQSQANRERDYQRTIRTRTKDILAGYQPPQRYGSPRCACWLSLSYWQCSCILHLSCRRDPTTGLPRFITIACISEVIHLLLVRLQVWLCNGSSPF